MYIVGVNRYLYLCYPTFTNRFPGKIFCGPRMNANNSILRFELKLCAITQPKSSDYIVIVELSRVLEVVAIASKSRCGERISRYLNCGGGARSCWGVVSTCINWILARDLAKSAFTSTRTRPAIFWFSATSRSRTSICLLSCAMLSLKTPEQISLNLPSNLICPCKLDLELFKFSISVSFTMALFLSASKNLSTSLMILRVKVYSSFDSSASDWGSYWALAGFCTNWTTSQS